MTSPKRRICRSTPISRPASLATLTACTRASGFALAAALGLVDRLHRQSRRSPYSVTEAVDRLRAARAAISASGERVLLTARSEAILRQAGGLAEALRAFPFTRKQAPTCFTCPWSNAGGSGRGRAGCGQAAGQCARRLAGITKRQLEDLGVKRISVGGALARAAWGGFMRAAKDIAENGRFDFFADLPTMGDITGAFVV